MPLLDSEILAEIDPAGLADRRAWFALRLRPRPRPRADGSANGVRLVLAIDRSSSMQGEKFEQARIAALVLLEQLGDDDAIALLAFDEEVRVVLPPGRMTAENKAIARTALFALQPGRGTALYSAAQRSLQIANTTQRGHVIFITDGYPYSGITDPAAILAMTAEHAGGSTLSTIGVGSELDAALLVAMAGAGGGRFLHIDAGGNLVPTLGGELATVRGAVTGKIRCEVHASRGFSIMTAPHYAAKHTTEDGVSVASVTLAPAVESADIIVPFELAWTSALEQSEHLAARITLQVGAPGAALREVLEVPVQLRIGAARGAMNAVVTRAVCDVVAGNALHRAALGEDDADVLDRALGDAAGWIRGRASAAGLDPARDLGPMLRVLAVAQTAFQNNEPVAPQLHAYAEGISRRYDADIGTKRGMLGDIRTVLQDDGAREAVERAKLDGEGSAR